MIYATLVFLILALIVSLYYGISLYKQNDETGIIYFFLVILDVIFLIPVVDKII